MSELRQRMIREMELRDFAENTQKAYLAAVEGLVRFYMKPPDQLNLEQVEDYLLWLKKERRSPYSTRNQITSGLKFFYNCTLKRDGFRLELPKKTGERKLPEVLAPGEVLRVVEAPANLKHRVLLKTTYSAGLRVGEVIALKPEHIDSARMLVRVESGKGRKDRDTILSKRLLPELRYYYKTCRPRNWLFPGKDPEKHICATTAQRAYTKAKKKAKIKKGKGIHTLRHCFATHLLEMGYDIRKIQMLTGHKSVQSTMIYLHVSRKHPTSVGSPLDLLGKESDAPAEKEKSDDGNE